MPVKGNIPPAEINKLAAINWNTSLVAGRHCLRSSHNPKRNIKKDPTSKAPIKRCSSEKPSNEIVSGQRLFLTTSQTAPKRKAGKNPTPPCKGVGCLCQRSARGATTQP